MASALPNIIWRISWRLKWAVITPVPIIINHHRHHHGGGGDEFDLGVCGQCFAICGSGCWRRFIGSLALVADALHNLSDAASLLLALAAQKIGRKGSRFPNALTAIKGRSFVNAGPIMSFWSYCLYGWRLKPWQDFLILILCPVGLWSGFLYWLLLLILERFALTYRGLSIPKTCARLICIIWEMLCHLSALLLPGVHCSVRWQWMDPLITLAISMYIIWHVVHEIPVVANILIDGNSDDMLFS